MKRFRLLLILIILYLIQTGCFLKSVHPLINEDEGLLLDGVEGIWESDDERWTFINNLSNFPDLAHLRDDTDSDVLIEQGYVILYEKKYEPADTAIFIGLVAEFADAYFLDLSVFSKSVNELEDDSDFVDRHFYPVHTFSKITLEDGNLSLEFFASSFIKDMIESNRIRIKHERPEDSESILITASTKELQKFVEKYAQDDDAFEDAMEFTYLGFSHEQHN